MILFLPETIAFKRQCWDTQYQYNCCSHPRSSDNFPQQHKFIGSLSNPLSFFSLPLASPQFALSSNPANTPPSRHRSMLHQAGGRFRLEWSEREDIWSPPPESRGVRAGPAASMPKLRLRWQKPCRVRMKWGGPVAIASTESTLWERYEGNPRLVTLACSYTQLYNLMWPRPGFAGATWKSVRGEIEEKFLLPYEQRYMKSIDLPQWI